MLLGGTPKRQREYRRTLQVLGQLGRLFLQARLNLAQALDPARWATVNRPWAFCLQRFIRRRLGDDLLLSLGKRLEPVAHAGKLFDGKLFFGITAGLLELVLRIIQVCQRLFFLLAGLFPVVLIQVALRLLHPAPGVLSCPRGPVGAQLGQPLKLPIKILAGSLPAPWPAGSSWSLRSCALGLLLRLPRLLQVLSLPCAGLGQLVLGVLELLDQPGQLLLAAILDRID